jgi:hypothetical protein
LFSETRTTEQSEEVVYSGTALLQQYHPVSTLATLASEHTSNESKFPQSNKEPAILKLQALCFASFSSSHFLPNN